MEWVDPHSCTLIALKDINMCSYLFSSSSFYIYRDNLCTFPILSYHLFDYYPHTLTIFKLQFQIECRARQNFSTLSSHNFAAILPGDSVSGILVTNGILNFLNIYNSLLVVRLVLTWFPNAPPAIVSPLR